VERARPKPNPKMLTGDIDVVASGLEILNEARTPPFRHRRQAVAGETRLRYRYLVAARPAAQNLALRIRCLIDGAASISTPSTSRSRPILPRSTPESARDYLVPSRVHPASSSRCRNRPRSSSRS
jgi:aspartyl-tRNA synthetase